MFPGSSDADTENPFQSVYEEQTLLLLKQDDGFPGSVFILGLILIY